jgi:hypothetical protein
MEYTDINDAFSVRINPLGANSVGSTPMGTIPRPPAINSNTDPVVILPQMTNSPITSPVYPESIMSDPSKAQRASAQHALYSPSGFPFVDAGSLHPPVIADREPGYIELMGSRKKDVMKLFILALMVTLGISIHWLGSHYIAEFIETSDFTPRQRLAIRISYPAAIVFVLWNLKALQ